jgi:hypothetical protein
MVDPDRNNLLLGPPLGPCAGAFKKANNYNYLAPRRGEHEVSKISDLRKSGKAKRSRVFRCVPCATFPPASSRFARSRELRIQALLGDLKANDTVAYERDAHSSVCSNRAAVRGRVVEAARENDTSSKLAQMSTRGIAFMPNAGWPC